MNERRPRARARQIRSRAAVGVATLGAFALRVWGINFGFPAIYRPDEDVVVGRAMGVLHGVVDPHFANWPHLYMYLSAAWLAALKPLFPLLGPAAPYLAVRFLDAIIGTATVLLIYRVGRRAYGTVTGVLAAALLAVAFLPVRDSHFATLDTPLTFACLLGMWAAIRLAEADSAQWRACGGIVLGLAAGIKYNGALVVASLAAAQAMHRRIPRRVIFGSLTIVAIGAATLVVTSPFLIIDLSSFRTALGYIFHQLSETNQPEIGYLHIPRLALWYGLEPPLFLLGLAGLVYAAVRRTTADWILLAFMIVYFGLIGAGHSVFVRYADPIVPPLLLLGARALVAAGERLTRPALAGAIAMAIVALPALAHDVAFDHLVQQVDTRTQAFDWLQRHVPPGSRVAILYFAGPAHDQAMIDRRDQSHGATDAYVASFLQNRFQDRYGVRELTQGDLNTNALANLEADGVGYVVYSPITPAGGCSPALPLLKALEAGATLRATFSPTNGQCTNAVFDPIDEYYVPLSGYGGWTRPGPTIQIFALPPPTG